MSMTLSEARSVEVGERIQAVISSGDPEMVAFEADAVVMECARRFILSQIAQRKRAAARSREADEKFREGVEASKERFRAKANLITTELAETLHREWSTALLAGKFSLPDGAFVSWAEATVAQHQARADQLESMAAGDMATAAIHRQAIADLRRAKVDRLGLL